MAEDPQDLGTRTVAFYGAGAMGSALLVALVTGGHPASQVIAVDAHGPALERVRQRYAVRTASRAAEAAPDAAIHVVAVKPADVAGVLAEIGEHLGEDDLVVSIAAGVPLAALEDALPEGAAVVRVMPNTPALVGEGMAVLAPGSACSPARSALAAAVLAPSGHVLTLPEKHLDAVTGLSGSGPAYVFYVAEALAEGGVLMGLPRDVAVTLAHQTLLGAATMLAQGEDSATVLRERVSSPGGTTMAGLAELDDRAVRAAFVAAVRRAAERSAELGR
ncbi:pyrroline-5-carboxylate reductase [Arsenicicoccus dermatophilus]|uniref:pyrroline-5-carboxylate reductase n=1 Tax=Arsenicicoccus dermatophilus TaxID=1076331 RepID=UPI001F4C9598|nr:pyrroline-5-carboxylate reductase [Arsenicicoccus dermatophilus]MCH8613883.1 pyrroline-5-carboxylate reductase [Arsenicicoccus dermatophilus]